MSGGVDSSVSAYLLKKAGHDVVGVFMKVWEAPFLPCTWREERRDAERVAAHLGIPLITLDLANVYKKDVVDAFVSSYKKGETPNPDVLCNREVKFGAFFDFAMEQGADAIATGHYARVEHASSGARLLRARDKEKDQTYFLWTIKQQVLQKTFFPIGHLQKSEVRDIANHAGIPTAMKKDSQGICFLGHVDMATFLREFLQVTPGDVEDEFGKVIGTHDGTVLYTLGERHGFRVSPQFTESKALFVVRKDVERNVLVVAPKQSDTRFVNQVRLREVHLISGKDFTAECRTGDISASLRYHQHDISVHLKSDSGELVLDKPVEAIAPGQSMVLYRTEECLGGGVVEESYMTTNKDGVVPMEKL